MKERRKYVRFPIVTKVKYNLCGKLSTQDSCLSKNFSGHGINICTKKELPIGKKINLSFSLPIKSKPIKAEGKVVWIKKEKGKVLTGIKFTKIDKYARDNIIDYIQRCLTWED